MTRPRSGARRAALGLVAGLVLTVTGWSGSQAMALTLSTTGTTAQVGAPTPTPSPTPRSTPSPTATTEPAVTVEVTSITPQVLDVTSDAHITVDARITNTSDATITSGHVTLSLAAQNMRTRTDVDRWTDGTADWPLQRLAQTDLIEPLAPGAAVDVTLTVGRTARQMQDDHTLVNVWGPRGLVVELDGTTPSAVHGETRTFLLVKSVPPDEEIPRAPVALLAALTGPPVAPTLPAVGDTADRTLDDATRHRVDTVVTAVELSPEVALAVDPALVTGGATDALTQLLADQTPWGEAGSTRTREVLTLPWADPDLQALAQTQTTDLLARARELAAAGRSSWPDDRVPDVVWSVDPLDAPTAAAVAASGATWLVAPSSATRTLTQVTTEHGNLTVVRPDEEVSALFDGSTSLTPAQAQQQALALLATAARGTSADSTPEPVLVATGRDWSADAAWTPAFVAALKGAPWVRLVTPTDLVAGDPDLSPGTVDTVTPSVGPTGLTGLTGLDVDRRELASFATVTDSPSLVTHGVDQATLQVASYAWRSDPEGRPAAAAALSASLADRHNALRLTERTDQTLISSAGDVRFNVRNDLPVAAKVRVRLEPDKACLGGDARAAPSDGSAARVSPIWSQVVDVKPDSDTPVPVTLFARANCVVAVHATLVGADGTAVSTTPVTFSVRVRAQIESVGTTVVGTLLGLGLVLGVIRTVRRGQSARRGDRTTDEPVRVGVLGGETPMAGIPVVKLLTPRGGIPKVRPPTQHDRTDGTT